MQTLEQFRQDRINYLRRKPDRSDIQSIELELLEDMQEIDRRSQLKEQSA